MDQEKKPAAKRTAKTKKTVRPTAQRSRARKPKSLAAKLADVQFELSKREIAATGHADVHKRDGTFAYSYDYLRESDLMRAIRGELALRNVAVLYGDEIIAAPSKDDPSTTVRVYFTFCDGDSDQTFEISGDGYAYSSDDRGANKAKTHAVRYLLWKTFLVPADEDPEQEEAEVVPRYRAESAAEQAERPAETAPAPARPARPRTTREAQNRDQRRARLVARLREVAEEKDARLGWDPGTAFAAALANYGVGDPVALSDAELVAAGVELSSDAPETDEPPRDPEADIPF